MQIRIPKLGVTMTQAVLAEWRVVDGQTVAAGDALYSIEMDKATNEIVAPVSGVLRIIGVIGETYAVGALIATIE